MSYMSTSLAKKRIDELLDNNSFVEIGELVTARSTDFNLGNVNNPNDGVITGYGIIQGNLVYVYSQDVSVLNGTIGEMHGKKIKNIYSLAMKMGAPVIGLIDCAGIRLQEATDALYAFGEIYSKQSLASGVIPQITAIFGNCGGGLAIMPTLSDFCLMENESKLYVNSPNTLDSNSLSKCNTASASFQEEYVGNVDFIGNTKEVIDKIRELITILPSNNEDDASYDECNDSLNRKTQGIETLVTDITKLISMVSDDNYFLELKKEYSKDICVGFLRLNGMTVGTVANRKDTLSYKGSSKAADFVNFCDSFNIPIVTFTNITGFLATLSDEKRIAKTTAKMIYAFSNATVPKVNLVLKYAYGSASIAMNSKSIGADVVYAWEGALIGMMEPKQAVKIIYQDEIIDEKDQVNFINEKAKVYEELQSSAISAARRGYIDSIIKPEDTRKYLIAAFEMLFTKKEDRPDKKHGTI